MDMSNNALSLCGTRVMATKQKPKTIYDIGNGIFAFDGEYTHFMQHKYIRAYRGNAHFSMFYFRTKGKCGPKTRQFISDFAKVSMFLICKKYTQKDIKAITRSNHINDEIKKAYYLVDGEVNLYRDKQETDLCDRDLLKKWFLEEVKARKLKGFKDSSFACTFFSSYEFEKRGCRFCWGREMKDFFDSRAHIFFPETNKPKEIGEEALKDVEFIQLNQSK